MTRRCKYHPLRLPMNPISSNMQQPKWGMFYMCSKLNINCNLFCFFSPNPLQSDCLTAIGKLDMLSTGNYFVCFVSEHAFRVMMWRAERTLSQSCLFDCRLASAFDVFNFIVRVCPRVCFFFFRTHRPSPATPTPRAPSATSCSRESWRASSGSSRWTGARKDGSGCA